MSSDDSEDEPLSILAAAKKTEPCIFVDQNVSNDEDYEPKKKKKRKRKICSKPKLSLTVKLSPRAKRVMIPKIVERPTDVWLYMKDLNPCGPYSCLLCSEWFINRPKMIVHYVLNHKKDFCGICRYFVPDREAWIAHMKFHIPWPCSQCIENFDTAVALRQHLSQVHKLVHCRLCHFRVPDDDHYNTHLFQKHNVTNVSCKDEETPWELEYEGATKFLCLLCSKSNILVSTFFNHYMGYHHFTLKCLTNLISGRDLPFEIFGVTVSSQFIDGQLKTQERFGYVDLEKKPLEQEVGNTESHPLLNIFVPEIKSEVVSDNEDSKALDATTEDSANDKTIEKENEITQTYQGDEDFDVTLMELIILQRSYFDYVKRTLVDINSNIVPDISDIDYESPKDEFVTEVACGLCNTKHRTAYHLTNHMGKMHSVKSVPIYSCRVCAATFDSQPELEAHITEELADFDDLWICQFCDKEFDNREATRRHLTEHIVVMEFDNCFSPHLGFKCKYCPMLFWNETERETHQVGVHIDKHKEKYYKCEACSETFSDKVWFIHHYMEKHQTSDVPAPIYLLKCCICCFVMPTVVEMRSHFENVHPEARKVFCSLDTCLYKPLSQRKSFKMHLKSVHGPGNRVDRAVNCSMCGREFPSSRACSTHMAQVHGPGKFKCKLCREVMHTIDERKLHYLISHPGRHPFECGECGKSFQYKSSLYMHKQEHAPNKQNFTCTYCGKIFKKRDSFREHLQIHEGPRHACSYCPMRFVQRSNMLRHERRHTGERPYACQHCPRTFADKGACTSHARTHSKDSSYACVYCGQTFVQKSKLTYHIRKHTGENLETCSICSKLFTSACALREHMKIHESKKGSVKCPLCDKRYQDERYMLRHLRTTHSRSNYSCPICSKAVTTPTSLRYHVLTHSTVNTYKCKACVKTFPVRKAVIKHLRRRHGISEGEINVKEFYERLDPRDCKLGLEENVIASIYGPPRTTSDVLIGDFVTLAKNLNIQNIKTGDGDVTDTNNDTQSDDEKNGSDKCDDVQKKIKEEEPSDNEELEPTDFVSVKIEPVDDV